MVNSGWQRCMPHGSREHLAVREKETQRSDKTILVYPYAGSCAFRGPPGRALFRSRNCTLYFWGWRRATNARKIPPTCIRPPDSIRQCRSSDFFAVWFMNTIIPPTLWDWVISVSLLILPPFLLSSVRGLPLPPPPLRNLPPLRGRCYYHGC